MALKSQIAAGRERWRSLSFYGKFEHLVTMVLSGLIALIILATLWNLVVKILASLIVMGGFDPADHEVFQVLFGMILTVIIALEFKRSLVVLPERRLSIVHVRGVLLIAMLAIVRKFIVLDLSSAEAGLVVALAAAILALGGVYWLACDQDRRDRAERRSSAP